MPELTVSIMTKDDVDAVHAIEAASFPTPYRTAQDEAMLLYGECEDDEAGDH